MENMDVNPEAAKASRKPSKMKAILFLVVALVLVLGGLYYFVFNQPKEVPPTLGAADQSLYQGLIQTGKYDFLSFDEEDVASWVKPEGNAVHLEYANSKEGLHYVASHTATTFKEILDSMNPSETKGEFMIAVYDDGFFMSPNDFYVAGEGVPLTIVPVEDMDTVTIKPNQFFILASNKDIELWGDFYTIESLPGNFDFCNQDIEGWFSGAFSGDITSGFEVTVDGTTVDCMPDQLWALNENTLEFEEIADLENVETLNTFIWTYYDIAPIDSVEAKLLEMEEIEETAELETTTPPQITDLTVFNATSTSIVLTWTAPGDEEFYDFKYTYDVHVFPSMITEENWEDTEQIVSGELIAEQTSEGIQMFITAESLSPDTAYYFALKVLDAEKNESDISNVYKTSTTQTTEELPAEELPAEEPPAEEPPAEELPAEGLPAEGSLVEDLYTEEPIELENSEITFELQPLEAEILTETTPPVLEFHYIYNTGGGIINDDIYTDASSDSAATIIGFEIENSGGTYAEITELTLGNTISEGLYDNENNYTHRVRWRNSTEDIDGPLGVYLAVLDKNTSGEVTNVRPIATDIDGDAEFSGSEFTAYERIDPGQTKTFILRISDLDTFRNDFIGSAIEYLYFAYNIENLKFKDSQNNILTGDDMINSPRNLPSPGDVTIYKK